MFVTLHKVINHCHNLVMMIILYRFHNSHSVKLTLIFSISDILLTLYFS